MVRVLLVFIYVTAWIDRGLLGLVGTAAIGGLMTRPRIARLAATRPASPRAMVSA